MFSAMRAQTVASGHGRCIGRNPQTRVDESNHVGSLPRAGLRKPMSWKVTAAHGDRAALARRR
jgi:hypothetical protein